MFDNAYALFFSAILIGCLFVLCRNLWRGRHDILLVLRGGLPRHLQVTARSGNFRVRPRRGPVFAPVKANICRL